jgi:transposase
MREEPFVVTAREEHRAQVLTRVLSGQWTQQEAALVLQRSVRQVRRLQQAYAREGVRALVHGNRGRPPTHALPAPVRERIVQLAQGKYAGFNHQHLTEKLDTEGIVVGAATVRRVLRAAGLRSPRTRRVAQHRQRRERMGQAGLLVQADGSRHRWLGPGGPYWTLIGGIDDATGEVAWAVFREQEDAQGYMEWLQHVAHTQGLPHALYVDRHGIFERRPRERWTLEEELAGGPLPTQFGRVLTELGIAVIHALSPQAKGRIERLWGTFQDRLVSELRLARVQTLAEANAFLARWLPQFNARFAVPAAVAGSAYRPLAPTFAPERVFCFKYTRVVAADNTVRWRGGSLQLLAGPDRLSYARAVVELHERLDGSLAVYYQDRCLATRPAPPIAPVLRARRLPRPAPTALPPTAPSPAAAPGPRRPAADHPWREPFTQKNGRTAREDRPPVLPCSGSLPAPEGIRQPAASPTGGQNH